MNPFHEYVSIDGTVTGAFHLGDVHRYSRGSKATTIYFRCGDPVLIMNEELPKLKKALEKFNTNGVFLEGTPPPRPELPNR